MPFYRIPSATAPRESNGWNCFLGRGSRIGRKDWNTAESVLTILYQVFMTNVRVQVFNLNDLMSIGRPPKLHDTELDLKCIRNVYQTCLLEVKFGVITNITPL